MSKCITVSEEIAISDYTMSQQIADAGYIEWFCPVCYSAGIRDSLPETCPRCGSEKTRRIPV